MKTRSLSVVSALASGLCAQPSSAADLPIRHERPVSLVQPSWTGFYFGGQTGAILDRRGDRFITSGDGGPVAVTTFGGRGGRTGVAVGEIESPTIFQGLHAGYNWQQGSAVFGLEADVNSLGQIDDVLASARARLGIGNERTLVYGTAGVAFLSLSSGVDGVFVGGNGGPGGNAGPGGEGGAGGNGFGSRIVTRDGTDRTGFVAGLGAEVKLSPQVGAGVEALYYAFDNGRSDRDIRNLEGPRDLVTLRGRLTFHFNGSDTPPSSSASLSSLSHPWAGFYVGGHIGALHHQSDRTINSVALANGEPGTAGVRGIDAGGGGGGAVAFAGLQRNAALTGGGHIGYNWHSRGLVFGAEADADASSNDGNRYFGSVRGRLGWTNHDYLFYGTAGVAVVRDESVRAIFAENGGPGGNGGVVVAAPGGAGGRGGRALAFGGDEARVGFVVGAGLEAKVSDRVTAGLEGLYYDFQDRRDPPPLPGNGRAFVSDDDTSDAFVVRTRFSFALHPSR